MKTTSADPSGDTAPDLDTPLGSDEAEALAQLLQAISAPARLRIVDLLERGSRTVAAISDELRMSQPTVSNHLRLLRHMAVVAGHREGRNVRYSLIDEHIATVIRQLRVHSAHR